MIGFIMPSIYICSASVRRAYENARLLIGFCSPSIGVDAHTRLYNAERQDARQYNANHRNLSTPGAAQFQLTVIKSNVEQPSSPSSTQ